MAAAALLAEALQLALPHECRQPYVHIAYPVSKMVCAELTHIPGAVLDLQSPIMRAMVYKRTKIGVLLAKKGFYDDPSNNVILLNFHKA